MANKHYETYFILDGNLEDSVIEDIITKYDSFLKKNGAEINNLDRIGRRRLAYQIKRKQNGYYVCFEFTADTKVISKLERNYKLDENILRNLTISMSTRTLQEKGDYLNKKAQIIAKAEAEAKEAASVPEIEAKEDLVENESAEK